MTSDEQRSIQLHSGALSQKGMVVVALSGEEAISTLFSFTVELSAADDNIDAAKILGESTTLLLQPMHSSGEKRYINGLVGEFINLGKDAGGDSRYQAVIVPELWFFGCSTRIRTHSFAGVPPLEVCKQLLNESGIDYRMLATDQTENISYFELQYHESDLDFILRFIADAGASFYFEHTQSSHRMVLVNSSTMYSKVPGKLRFSNSKSAFAGNETVTGWRKVYRCTARKATHYDYDNRIHLTLHAELSGSEKAQSIIQKQEQSAFALGFANLDTEGGIPSLGNDAVHQQAKIALRRHEGKTVQIHSSSDCVRLAAGHNFTLKESPPGGNGNFIITRIRHSATSGTDTGTSYRNEFECIPDTAEIAPQRLHAPEFHGTLVATVVESEYGSSSPAKRKYGLVKVSFPWDEKTQSHWIQVSQIFGGAGSESGAWFLPQIDDNVLVSFIAGDTRRPIVTGIMLNGSDEGPSFTNGHGAYTRSGLKTPIGHELSFTDKGGKNEPEEVYLESTGNFDRLIKKNETADIKIDQEINVGEKVIIEAGRSIELKVGSNTVLIDANGIHMKGQNVDAKAQVDAKIEGMNFTAKGLANTKVEGAISEFSAQGMATVKGAMVNIN